MINKDFIVKEDSHLMDIMWQINDENDFNTFWDSYLELQLKNNAGKSELDVFNQCTRNIFYLLGYYANDFKQRFLCNLLIQKVLTKVNCNSHEDLVGKTVEYHTTDKSYSWMNGSYNIKEVKNNGLRLLCTDKRNPEREVNFSLFGKGVYLVI